MSEINDERMIADLDGEFLVFIIELQVHKLWQFWRWYPVVQAMTKMIVELLENKEYGLLHYEYRFSFRRQFILMYWRSYEHMHDWALNKNAAHIEGWRMLNKLVKEHPNLIGFWHESYVVSQYESFYRNVPAVGLGQAGTLHPIRGNARTAAQKLREERDKAAVATTGAPAEAQAK
ncbi:MAG: DUF4188 domain-containing protein [Candidatus Promineifilaceae bacterium]|nr:DUF4188 domain-containing protein [Candidatus Promineifilaceae bacterium]